jgi:hypothetical protein
VHQRPFSMSGRGPTVTPGAYSRSRSRRGLDGEVVQEAFGEVLRALYSDVRGEPVPASLVAIARRLDGRTA